MKSQIKISTAALLLSAVLFQGCSKEVLVTSGGHLGVRTVGADGGEFPVLVNTSGAWQASSLSQWISVDAGIHRDGGTFTVKYESNTSYYGKTQLNRLGKIVVATCDGAQADTLVLRQRGLDPYISFDSDNPIPLSGGEVSVPARSNFGDDSRNCLSFSSDALWISDINWGADGRSIVFMAQPSSSEREAVITVTFTPQWGDIYSAECHITQIQ